MSIAGLVTLIGVIFVCVICGLLSRESSKDNKTEIKNANNQNASNVVLVKPTPPPTFAELKSQGEKLLLIKQDDYETIELKKFDDVMQPLREIPKDSKDYKTAQNLLKKLIDKSSVIGAERVVLGEKPIQSGWDGSVLPVKQYLQRVLNDYDSSEFVEWSPVSKIYIGKEPYWGVRLKLRAKNAFGAFVMRDTYYFIRQNEVVITKGLE